VIFIEAISHASLPSSTPKLNSSAPFDETDKILTTRAEILEFCDVRHFVEPTFLRN